jgi:hypothetical protein
MARHRNGQGISMGTPLVSRFAGLQALGCGIVGVLLSVLLDQLGLYRISTAAGVFVSVTLLLIVLGRSLLGSARLWLTIGVVSLVNISGAFAFYKIPELKPITMAPFLLIELLIYLTIIDYLRKSSQR